MSNSTSIKSVFHRMEKNKTIKKTGIVMSKKLHSKVDVTIFPFVFSKIVTSWDKELTYIILNENYSYMNKVPWQIGSWFDIIYDNIMKKNISAFDVNDHDILEYYMRKNIDDDEIINMIYRNPFFEEVTNPCFDHLNEILGNILKSYRDFFLLFKEDDEILVKWKYDVKRILLESIYNFIDETRHDDDDDDGEDVCLEDQNGFDTHCEYDFEYDDDLFESPDELNEDYSDLEVEDFLDDDDDVHEVSFEYKQKGFMYK